MFGLIAGAVAVGAAVVGAARGLVREYSNYRLRKDRDVTQQAIDEAESVCSSAERDVRTHAEQIGLELQDFRSEVKQRLESDKNFYLQLQPTLAAYLDVAVPFDDARQQVRVYSTMIQTLTNSCSQIDILIHQTDAEMEQLQNAANLLSHATDITPHYKLISACHPELAAALQNTGGRLSLAKEVLDQWIERCESKPEQNVVRQLANYLQECSEVAQDLSYLEWAKEEVNRRRQSLQKARRRLIKNKSAASKARKAANEFINTQSPIVLEKSKALLALVHIQLQQVRLSLREANEYFQSCMLDVKEACQEHTNISQKLKPFYDNKDWSSCDKNIISDLKNRKAEVKLNINSFKLKQDAARCTKDKLMAERDVLLGRQNLIGSFFKENLIAELNPSSISRYIENRHKKKQQFESAAENMAVSHE